MAALSTLYLLFGNAGVVQRSERTCYPIPTEVEALLKQQCSLESLKNIPATQAGGGVGWVAFGWVAGPSASRLVLRQGGSECRVV